MQMLGSIATTAICVAFVPLALEVDRRLQQCWARMRN